MDEKEMTDVEVVEQMFEEMDRVHWINEHTWILMPEENG